MNNREVPNESKIVVSLFEFIKELNQSKQRSILDYTEYPWAKALSSFSKDPENIVINYRDRVEEEEYTEGNQVLLSIKKPEFEKCPDPAPIFFEWLRPGWESFRNEVQCIESRVLNSDLNKCIITKDGEESQLENIELFTDDTERVNAYNAWLDIRTLWVERQKILLQTRDLFSDLYRLYFELQRDSETMELIVANGILLDKKMKKSIIRYLLNA